MNREDLSHFYALNDPFLVYFLGFFWADGTLSKTTSNMRFKIVKSDFDMIKDRAFQLAKSWCYREDWDRIENHQVQSVLELNHKGVHAFLVQMGYQTKSGGSASTILSKIPSNLRHYWWRGYFDGDGCFMFDGQTVRVSLVSGYSQEWDFTENLLQELNIHYRINRSRNETRGNSTVNMENESAVMKFMEFILQGESFGLKRKYEKYYSYLACKKTVRQAKTSQYRGVDRVKNKWRMQFYSHGFRKSGSFNTEEEAAKAYDKLARQYHGNRVSLNFPNV